MTSSTSHPKWADPGKIQQLPQDLLEARLAMLREIKPQDLASWRHHPVSRLLLQFLADYRDERLREAIGAWFDGALVPLQEAEGRGRALLADEIIALRHEDLLRFYGVQPPAASPEELVR